MFLGLKIQLFICISALCLLCNSTFPSRECVFTQDTANKCVIYATICEIDIYLDDFPNSVPANFLIVEKQIKHLKKIINLQYLSKRMAILTKIIEKIKETKKNLVNQKELLSNTPYHHNLWLKKMKKNIRSLQSQLYNLIKKKDKVKKQIIELQDLLDTLDVNYISIQIDDETKVKIDQYQISQNQQKLNFVLTLYRLKTIFLHLDDITKKGNTPQLIASFFGLEIKEVKDYNLCINSITYCVAKFQCIKLERFDEVFPTNNDSKKGYYDNRLYPNLDLEIQNTITSIASTNHMVYVPKMDNEINEITLIDQQIKDESKNRLKFTWNNTYKFFEMRLSEDESLCVITEMLNLKEKN